MQSNEPALTRRVTVHHLEGACVIEVDGELDVVGAHDLRQVVASALRGSTDAVILDLSSVTAVDDQGLASLEWCSARAVNAGRVLTWASCSQPFKRGLEGRVNNPSGAPLDRQGYGRAKDHTGTTSVSTGIRSASATSSRNRPST